MNYNSNNIFQLSIDKISITTNDTNIEYAYETCDRLRHLAVNRPYMIRIKPGNRHYLQAVIFIEGSTSPLFFQAGARSPKIADYRIEFNPAKMGPDGLEQIRLILDDITDIGFERFVSGGKVTRLDVALDLPKVSLEDVIIRSRGQRKHGVFCGQKGLESAYQGSQKSNSTCYYSKKHGPKDYRLRLERRLKPNCLGRDMARMPNPFAKVDMVLTSSIKPLLDGLVPEHFFDSVRLRGFTKVLKSLPRKQRLAIEKALKEPFHTMLPPMADIWAQWPALIDGLTRNDQFQLRANSLNTILCGVGTN